MSKVVVWVSAALVLLSLTGSAGAEAPPRIEVAFAIDATGSMSPYIEQARQRIHQIAESLAEGNPRPEVRFALVAYRDKGDEFVTHASPFTRDLAAMKRYLDATSADGGGDTPEAVLEGLKAAITGLGWTPASNDGVVRLLYLVGDAPPQHYADSPTEPWIAREARKRHIVIHSIACGADSSLESSFEPIARFTEGRYFRLDDAPARVARGGLAGSKSTLAGTLTDTTRAYGAAVGVAYDGSGGEPVSVAPLEAAGPAGLSKASGLRGAHVRWVRDAATWNAIWAAHMSETRNADKEPAPSVDFAEHQVLVLGGSDVGLALEGVSQRQGKRFVRVKPIETPGATFVLLPARKGES